MTKLQNFRDRYKTGDGEKVTAELHALSIDELVLELEAIGISYSRQRGRPKALEKAASYIVNGTRG